MVSLLDKGMDYDQIRKLNEEQNIFAAATKERRLQIFRTVSARVKSL